MKQLPNTIYTVVWWTGTGVATSMFLNADSAYAYAERIQKRGGFIAIAEKTYIQKEYFERLARKCVDREPPKKN